MRKAMTAAAAAITITGLLAPLAPAQAQAYYGRGSQYGDSWGRGVRSSRQNDSSKAIIAGIAGLAIGAALASSNGRGHSSYGAGYYAPDYGSGYGSGYGALGYDGGWGSAGGYPNAYGYGSGYRVCETRQQIVDPYSGSVSTVRSRYAC